MYRGVVELLVTATFIVKGSPEFKSDVLDESDRVIASLA
jgi:hypothetical protein